MKKTYRIAKAGPALHEGSCAFRPGSEIELDEDRARSHGDTLELDRQGRPVIVREEKAIEKPPVDKMFGSEKATRKERA